MAKPIFLKAALGFYNLSWRLVIPALRLNHRLAEGFNERILKQKLLPKADLWIQAASAGESYLAWEILKNLSFSPPKNVLVTTNTRQGMEILERARNDINSNPRGLSVSAAYFPFDQPAIMAKAVSQVCPRVMVLLESEIWPGLLTCLKQYGSKIWIINGRLTQKSLRRYRILPTLWYRLRPDKILAISKHDARRFRTLFGSENIDVMPNIKFDRFNPTDSVTSEKSRIAEIIRPDIPFIVLASVRRQEELQVEKIIMDIFRRKPEVVIGLFPRHMHRINHWKKILERLKISWTLRSATENPVSAGTVVLWDTFGELSFAYRLSKAVFVGGSLEPLGGQNFLEPLTCGIVPVIGPFWDNFAWVGREIVEQGLLREAGNWQETANILIESLDQTPEREQIIKTAFSYFKKHQGGTLSVCRLIAKELS